LFRGINAINLDEKGRMAVPTKYRSELAEFCEGQMILTIGFDRCLLLLPLPTFEEVERKLMKLPMMDPRVQRVKRLLIGHASECELDGQGRFLVPEPLRNFAGISKRVAMVGQGNVFEIWNEEAWHQNRDAWHDVVSLDDLRELSPELGSLTF
jgi:MraZ protein